MAEREAKTEALESKSPLQRERIMVTEMQRDLNIPRSATPLPHASLSPFPFLLWRSWVIRRNSLLGKRRGWCPCVLIPGQGLQRDLGNFKEGKPKLYCS